MTQEISSLMDGELEAPEAERAMHACCMSEEQKQTWLVYHVIGDSMRGQAPRGLGIPGAIEAIRKQPTILAPRRRLAEMPFTRVALAAAASVATIGVVGWIGMQGGQLGREPAVVAKATEASPAMASAVPVSQVSQVSQPLNVQDYLVAHRQMPSPELYRQVSNQAPAAPR